MTLEKAMNQRSYYFYPYQNLWIKTRKNAILNIVVEGNEIVDCYLSTIHHVTELKDVEDIADNYMTLKNDVKELKKCLAQI